METKYTQSKWTISREPFTLLITHTNLASRVLSVCQVTTNNKTEEEAEANANLIESAPDLLEAVILLKGIYDTNTVLSTDNYNKIEALIKKLS